MFNFRPVLLGAMMTASLSLPAAGQDAVSADTVVARVGDNEITLGHIIAAIPALTEQEQQLPDGILLEGMIERLVQQEAVASAATEVTKVVRLSVENERRSLIAADVVNRLAAEVEVTEEGIKAAYDARFADFTPDPEYRPSHILVATEEEAQAVLEELRAGADFAELAKEKSTGPTGPNGGDLGWTHLGRTVPPFEAAMVALEVGEISEPVQTQFGWHVLKLNDIRQPGVPALEQIRGEIEAEVWQLNLRNAIDEIVGAVEIERPDVSAIDPSVVRDLSLIQN